MLMKEKSNNIYSRILFFVREYSFVILLIITYFVSMAAIGYRMNEVQATRNRLNEAEVKEYLVQSGDNLWNIAEQTGFEQMDVRDIIERIKELNNMQSVDIYPGDLIKIPVP